MFWHSWKCWRSVLLPNASIMKWTGASQSACGPVLVCGRSIAIIPVWQQTGQNCCQLSLPLFAVKISDSFSTEPFLHLRFTSRPNIVGAKQTSLYTKLISTRKNVRNRVGEAYKQQHCYNPLITFKNSNVFRLIGIPWFAHCLPNKAICKYTRFHGYE